MHFEAFSFGSIRIDGKTYEHDVVIDRGHIGKRKKKPSKKFRDAFGHTPLSVGEDIPWRCRRLVIGTGTGAMPVMEEVKRRSASPQNQIGHTADNRSYQGAAGKPRGDQCGPARYMLEVESDPELEKALDRYACRLHPRRPHDAAGYSSRRDGSRNPGRDDGRYPMDADDVAFFS